MTALVRKFIAALKNPVIDRSIVAGDIQLAERQWVVELQSSLKENKEYFDKLNEYLGSFEEDGLIRCAGTLRRSVLPYSSKSDNAKPFKDANKEIVKLFKSAEVQEYVAQNNIVWKFILERVPWFGGFYELMVQAVKQPLRKILGNARIDYEE